MSAANAKSGSGDPVVHPLSATGQATVVAPAVAYIGERTIVHTRSVKVSRHRNKRAGGVEPHRQQDIGRNQNIVGRGVGQRDGQSISSEREDSRGG